MILGPANEPAAELPEEGRQRGPTDDWAGLGGPRQLTKYPRTPYMPFSPTIGRDELVFDPTQLLGKSLVVTIKMDGSNVSLSREKLGARSGDDPTHASFNMLKQIHARMSHLIPESIQLFAEWLYAKHSIPYAGDLALRSYLQVFSAFDRSTNTLLSWGKTVALCNELDVVTVPVVAHIGPLRSVALIEEDVAKLFSLVVSQGHEGIVVRNTDDFPMSTFTSNIAKVVRAGHVQTTDSWRYEKIVRNELQQPGGS